METGYPEQLAELSKEIKRNWTGLVNLREPVNIVYYRGYQVHFSWSESNLY